MSAFTVKMLSPAVSSLSSVYVYLSSVTDGVASTVLSPLQSLMFSRMLSGSLTVNPSDVMSNGLSMPSVLMFRLPRVTFFRPQYTSAVTPE